MNRSFLLSLLFILALASTAAASVTQFEFTFSGPTATATGTMGIDLDKIGGTFTASTYLWDPTGAYLADYGNGIAGLVTYLDVTVTYPSAPTETYHLSDFDAMVLDLSKFSQPFELYTNLVGQNTGSDGLWGTSGSGDFQIFATWLNGGVDPPVAPTGSGPASPFEVIANSNTTADTMQLTQLNAVPEPSTYLLLTIALGVVGYARKRVVKGER